MADMVRRRSRGGVLPLGRHASSSGSSLIHCVSVSMAPPHPGGAKCYPGAEVQGRTGPRTVERLMSEGMPLQVAPETLDVVRLRSIFRQPLDGEPVGALGERGAACLAGVDRAVVQDEHEGLDRDA